MNTETLDLIQSVIEEIIAAIPQIVVVLTTVVYSLKAIKERVGSFPKIADETKNEVNKKLSQTKDEVNSKLAEANNAMSELLKNANTDMQGKVGNTLQIMEKELHDYKEQLKVNIEQTNLFLRQNKVLVDVLLDIVVQDPEKVSSGIAQKVSSKLNLAKEQLENYPQTLVSDIKVLENAMKEVHTLIGEKEFEKLLSKIGYGKGN